MKNDLHVRTNFSASASKEWDWQKVLQKCQEEKIERLAITDFDTCLFHVINKIFDTSPYFMGQIISGMECDVCENGVTFELLAYNFEPFKTLTWSYETYGTLSMRQTKIKNILLDTAKAQQIAVDTSIPFNGKAEFAHNYVYDCMKKCKENEQFFEKFNIKNASDFYNASTKQVDFPLYVNMNQVFPSVKSVVDFIHSVGGFVALAQPFRSKNKDNIEFLLKTSLAAGVDGIEVYHPTHTPDDIQYLLNYCKQNNLIVTGGSNFNGKPDYMEVGIKNIDKDEKEILQGMSI